MVINSNSGKLIDFEGIDGSGKSEQFSRTINFLQAYYPKLNFVSTKEPTKDPSGVEIYEILNGRHATEELSLMHRFHFQSFYFKNRIHHRKRLVNPSLEKGTHVISDSGVASGSFGIKSPKDFPAVIGIQEQMFLSAEVPFIWPDLILIFDVDVSIAMERLKQKGIVLDQFEKEDNLRRVSGNYLAFAGTYQNCQVIDGTRTPEQVFTEVKRFIYPVLRLD